MMFCQNCKTPLKADTCLDDLNPAAFNLLVEATKPAADRIPAQSASRRLYNKEQKALYDRVSAAVPDPFLKRNVTPTRHGYETTAVPAPTERALDTGNPAMSFVMLTESQLTPPPANSRRPTTSTDSRHTRSTSSNTSASRREDENLLSHKMETTARLFEILSSRSDIDHPICTECTETLLEGMEKRLANATRERDAYADFLKNAVADVPTEEEQAQAQQELVSLRNQEAAALFELESLEAEKAALDAELAALEADSRTLDEEEAAFWRERNAFAATLAEFQAERDSVNLRYDADARQLVRLQRTNVYNDTFCISYDGFFGTINNLRLGRLTGHGVEWAEVNAALGMTCLLVATVAEKLVYTFQGYQLHPMGSTSSVEKISETSPRVSTTTRGSDASSINYTAGSTASSTKATSTSLPLYYTGDLPLGIGFLHRNFDSAMVAFLECIRQLGEHIERTTRGTQLGGEYGLRMPYEIKKDRIHDVSIKLGTFGGFGGASSKFGGGASGDEAWTKACKFMLTCCKFCLAHASNVRGGGGTAGRAASGSATGGAKQDAGGDGGRQNGAGTGTGTKKVVAD